jgi:hypothetical protein
MIVLMLRRSKRKVTWTVCVLIVVLAFIACAEGQTINRNPTFTLGPEVEVPENGGTMAYKAWVPTASIRDGEGGATNIQTLTFLVAADKPQLFKTQPAITSSGDLSFEPAPDQNGIAIITVTLQDDGISQCQDPVPQGSVSRCPCVPVDCRKSITYTFRITIHPVNDCPSFRIPSNTDTVTEDVGEITRLNFFNSIFPGPTQPSPQNENDQSLVWTLTSNNRDLFQTQPTVIYTQGSTSAHLFYKPAQDACGTAKVTASLQDSGGTSTGGCDTAPSATFTINVQPVNDRPTFDLPTSRVITVLEDSGPFVKDGIVTAVSAGANEASQQVSFNTQWADANCESVFTWAGTGSLGW